MTNLGPLTTTFTPIGPDCASTFLGFNQDNAWVQYGVGGSASAACFPSGFTRAESYFYSPGIYGLTTELRAGSRIATWSDNFILAYGPIVRIAQDDIIPTGTATESSLSSSLSLSLSISQSSSSTAASATPLDPDTSQPPGLSRGAVAGIAVGASLAGIIVIGAVALLLRRRRRLNGAHPVATVSETDVMVKPHQHGMYPQDNGQKEQQQQQLYGLNARPGQTQLYELNAMGE
ncbi:hypothetical protein F5Y14DRAFT_464484 [Nemania sp. NC0429]|nr:hypothetical protein F5Y14DRAFT_464484 [Nemania sp. NC0429]